MEERKETERILSMLGSADREMVELGMILALQKDEEWFIENIPSFGPATRAICIGRDNTLPIFGFHNGVIAIIFSPGLGIDARFLTSFSYFRGEIKSIKDYEES